MSVSEKPVLPHFLGHTLFVTLLALTAAGLTYHYFNGEYGKYELDRLTKELKEQKQLNQLEVQKLQRLRADVKDLKSGLVAIEEHARTDLGLIKEGEIFVQLSEISKIQSAEPVVLNEPDADEVLEIMSNETPNSDIIQSSQSNIEKP